VTKPEEVRAWLASASVDDLKSLGPEPLLLGARAALRGEDDTDLASEVEDVLRRYVGECTAR
jgi:hypothetical protein